MLRRNNRLLLLVALAHLVVLVSLILITQPSRDRFYSSPVTAVELLAAVEIASEPAKEEPEPAPEEPEPLPEPIFEPEPEPAPAAEEKPPPRKIVKQVIPPRIPPSDLKQRLRERLERVEAAAPRQPAAVSASREDRFPYSWYNDFVQSKMYNLWKRPPRAAVGKDRATAVVSFRVFRDGHIENIRLQESSGSQVMDDSALQAARRADPLPPLPSGFQGAHEDFLILFELK
jgi:periplasmic protein TonB